MKLFITSIVAVVTLSTLTTGEVHAQKSLEITKMDGVQSQQPETDVRAFVKNNSRETIDLTTYSFTGKTKGSSFSPSITTMGPFTITRGATQIIEGRFARTSDLTDIEFTVTGVERNTNTPHTASKRFQMRGVKILWDVKYGTNGQWVLAGVFRGDFGDPKVNIDAGKLSKSLHDRFGFKTKRETKTNTGVFGIGGYHRAAVYVQTTKDLERTFDDKESAKAFQDSLHKQFFNNSGVTDILLDNVVQVGNPRVELSSKRLDSIRRRAAGGGN